MGIYNAHIKSYGGGRKDASGLVIPIGSYSSEYQTFEPQVISLTQWIETLADVVAMEVVFDRAIHNELSIVSTGYSAMHKSVFIMYPQNSNAFSTYRAGGFMDVNIDGPDGTEDHLYLVVRPFTVDGEQKVIHFYQASISDNGSGFVFDNSLLRPTRIILTYS